MKHFLFLLLLPLSVSAEAPILTTLSWEPVQGATGYRVRCSDGSKETLVRATVETRLSLNNLPDMPASTCTVSAFNSTTDSGPSLKATPLLESVGGKTYLLDSSANIDKAGNICLNVQLTYSVVKNPSAADGSRPLMRLKDSSIPFNKDSNPLIYIAEVPKEQRRIAAGSRCEVKPVATSPTGGFWMYATNSSGVRGITLCQRDI